MIDFIYCLLILAIHKGLHIAIRVNGSFVELILSLQLKTTVKYSYTSKTVLMMKHINMSSLTYLLLKYMVQ